MSEATDPELLAWASKVGRIIIAHDHMTMPGHAANLMSTGLNIAGLFIALRRLPLHQVLEDLELMIMCSDNDEWINVIRYLHL